MKVSDLATGLFLVVLGISVLVYGALLPPMPGQRYGAGLFPMLLGACFAGLGLVLARQGARDRLAVGGPLIQLAEWAGNRQRLTNILLVPVLVIIYVLFSERIGFIPMSLGILMILFVRFSVPPVKATVIAIAATAFIHVAFVKLLRVPLPRGLLAGILW